MILRIIYCIIFIKNFYSKLYTKESSFFLNFHNFGIVSVAGVSISIINWVTIGYVRNFKQLFINVTFALLLLVLILVKERTYIKGMIGKNKLTEVKEI